MRLAIKTPTREFEFTARDGAANIVVGNRSYDDICIADDPGVSGPHVRLEFFIGKWTFSDQFSSAGTIHNGSKKSSGELAQGDVLTLGGTTLRVLDLAGKSDTASPFAVTPPADSPETLPTRLESAPAFASNDTGVLRAEPPKPVHSPPPPAASPHAAVPPRAELVAMLYAALVTAARREDDLAPDDADPLNEYRALAERGVAGTTPWRVRHVYVPLLVTGEAFNFDIEDELKGELQPDLDDLSESERRVYEFLLAEAERLAGRALSAEPLVRERLADAASDADTELQQGGSAEVRVPWLSADERGPVHLCVKISTFAGKYRVDSTLPLPAEPSLPVLPVSAPAAAQATGGANAIFVRRIEALLARTFAGQTGLDPRADAQAIARLAEAARKAVVELESSRATEVNLPFLMAASDGPRHLVMTVERWHLHERAEDEHVPQRTPPADRDSAPARAGSSGGSRKKNNPPVVVAVVIGVIVLGVVMALAAADGSEEQQAVMRQAEQAEKESIRQEEMRKAIREASRNDSKIPPEEQLKLLVKLGDDAAGMGLEPELTAAKNTVSQRIYATLARRYNAVSLDVRQSLDAGNFAKAETQRAEFMKHVDSDPYRAAQKTRLQIDRWNSDRVAEIADGNRRLIARGFEDALNALELNQFSVAAKALDSIVAGALLPEITRSLLRAEADAIRHKAGEQERGEIDPPLKRLPAPPRLPAFPQNDLLPLGGTTASRHFSALRQKVTDWLRRADTGTVAVRYRGMDATARTADKGRDVQLTVQRPLRTVDPPLLVEYEVVASLTNLPDDTQYALYLAVPDKTLADWLGLLHFCFDRGLGEKAGAVAAQIRKLEPDKTRELDQLLAAKWQKPVPENGFPERDGRVLPE
ncbi:MAG: Hsp70 family protein [Planctomycetes bacterium]|nr:Hsp70 family protein [Planctomycetota bacterium]MCL4729219.1 Hsp70 family protein [Planctomycetota bacterium]